MLKHKVLQSHLQALHSMILIIYILTPFTMASTLSLFHGFRIIQTRMMVLSVIHGLQPNQKLKAILEGCANLNHRWGSSLTAHNLFAEAFFLPQCVCIRFTHIMSMQPILGLQCAILWIANTVAPGNFSNSPMTSLSKLNNWYAWAPIRLFVGRADYRCLELALIQEWQPRLNYPFICQFFHPRKGILKKPAMNTNAQFGLATLKDILASDRCQNRLELWTIIHSLGINTKARFEQTKFLRSNEGGLTQCYTLRRLANNIQEPYRTLSLQAIDASIRWWRGNPAPRASALRAPWSLSPNLQKSLKQFLRNWHLQVLSYQVPCHTPSFKTVFIKHASVLDQLCNHKHAISQWSTNPNAQCCCQRWSQYKKAAINPSDPHWVLAGSLLTGLLPDDLSVIAAGSLLNKVFPSKKCTTPP